jgi:hypothetical protein
MNSTPLVVSISTNITQKNLFASYVKDTIQNPISWKIGKYLVYGNAYKGGSLLTTDGFKFYFDKSFYSVTEYDINYLKNRWLQEKAKLRAEEKAKQAKLDAQTTEYVTLISKALAKNPDLLSLTFKEHPEILQKTLSPIINQILPDLLRAELKEFRTELTSSIHAKLPEIVHKMILEES